MSLAKIILKNWPFSEGTRARLHWIRSPYQVGESRQWRMTVVFIAEDGDSKEIRVPWGMLPMLRLGEIYCNGQSTGEFPGLERRPIRFSKSLDISVCESIVIPSGLCRLGSKWNLQEKCVKIVDGDFRVIIPCLEIIRAYFATTRLMASEMLSPDSFNGICNSNLENHKARLVFSNKVSANIITASLATRIALVLEDSEFNNSWRQIWASASQGDGTSLREPANPLWCYPPAIRKSSWDAVGIGTGNTFLVMGIERFKIDRMTAFFKLYYEHPLFREPDGSGTGEGSSGEVIKDDPKEVEVGSEPAAPKSLTDPQVVELETCAASFLRTIDVIKIKKKSDGLGGGRGEKTGGVGARNHSGQIKEGTLDCEAGAGELPAVEFKDVSPIKNLNDAFKKLTKALEYIDLKILWCAQESAPESCKLPLLDGNPRQYLSVYFLFAGRRFFLHEVDNSDRHSLSTLVYERELPLGLTGFFSQDLLVKCVTGGGHWDATLLDIHLDESAYCFVKHRKATVESWKQRLNNALINLKLKSGKP